MLRLVISKFRWWQEQLHEGHNNSGPSHQRRVCPAGLSSCRRRRSFSRCWMQQGSWLPVVSLPPLSAIVHSMMPNLPTGKELCQKLGSPAETTNIQLLQACDCKAGHAACQKFAISEVWQTPNSYIDCQHFQATQLRSQLTRIQKGHRTTTFYRSHFGLGGCARGQRNSCPSKYHYAWLTPQISFIMQATSCRCHDS